MRLVNGPLERIFVQEFTRQLEPLRDEMRDRPGGPPFDLNKWKATLSDGMRPFYALAFTTGGRNLLMTSPTIQERLREERGSMASVLKQAGGVTQLFSTRMSRRIGRMVDTYFGLFEELLTEAVELQLDGDDIAVLLEEQWQEVLGVNVPAAAITETQVGVNSAREYVAQQVVELWDWVTAGDERVRVNHQVYGQADPKPVGFNWASLVQGSYVLKYPADPACDEASEVVNCRCMTVPAGDIELSPDEAEAFLGDLGLEPDDLFQAEDSTPGWVDTHWQQQARLERERAET
jgi:hypothetical protein